MRSRVRLYKLTHAMTLNRQAAHLIERSFDEFFREFGAITLKAQERFEKRNWHGALHDSVERLDLRGLWVEKTIAKLTALLGPRLEDRDLWTVIKEDYRKEASQRPDVELAEIFYSSVTRKIFATVGVDPSVEFTAAECSQGMLDPCLAAEIFKTFVFEGSAEALISSILDFFKFKVPFADPDQEAERAAEVLHGFLSHTPDAAPLHSVDILKPIFYRGHGAYLIGRLWRGLETTPFILPLLNSDEGIHLDALLLEKRDAAIVFSFTRSYFRVQIDRPHEVNLFLKSILPLKRTSELYISVGHNKYGKTELYREIMEDLASTEDQFEVAPGDKGMVMAVFTLPSLSLVFKVIRDRFPPSKSMTPQEVKQKYQLVFHHDRAGRLVDAQEFERLSFDLKRFSKAVLDELLAECADTVKIEGDHVLIKHLYVERRITPLNLFLRQSDAAIADQAVIDYGQSLKDLAATNTFPGDLLLKNFGVTRAGRVIFYDYDELALVVDCNFRELPTASTHEDETRGEPWFYVGERDIFPEEFLRFLNFSDRQRQVFLEHHAEILTAGFWLKMQTRLRAGEVVDIFPYREDQRLCNLLRTSPNSNTKGTSHETHLPT